jgi:SAM-dependent methyltransferase
MVQHARKYNRYADRCTYLVNETTSLRGFDDESWDFVFSTIVLQHMIPQYSVNYVKEFLRILRPGGVLLFQIPAGLISVLSELSDGLTDISAERSTLPDTAFRAQIKSHAATIVAKPASRINVIVTVKNLSPVTWPSMKEFADCPIGVGNHWLSEKGETVIEDDARTSLDWSVKPNGERTLLLECTTPDAPGNYMLELDMVQDTVTWFVSKGSEVARVPVKITRNPTTVWSPNGSASQLQMEMYGVPKEQILEVIVGAGGRVVHVQEDLSAGPEWTSYLYCAVKEGTREEVADRD